MRSFVACLLNAIVTHRLLVLIDEPEAFLHPAQCRLLGSLLANLRPANQQLIVATHSGDIVRGMLAGEARGLTVLRVERRGTTNTVSRLAPEQVRGLWADPVLRFSNPLDAIFHERAIVCEGDSDCRFYAAVLDALFDGKPTARRPDVMFVPSGGKQRVPRVVGAVTALQLPCTAVCDFDVLREENRVAAIIAALGADWQGIRPLWRRVNQVIKQRGLNTAPRADSVKREISRVLDSITTPEVPDTAIDEIREAVRRASPWDELKRTGTAAFESGAPTSDVHALLQALQTAGLFVVPCGVLERFVPAIGGERSVWVARALGLDLASDPSLESARRFVTNLISWEPARE